MLNNSNNNYRSISFSAETYHAHFYIYANVKELINKCETYRVEIQKCRTVGILLSQHGKFFLADLDAAGAQSNSQLQVSITYLNSPLPSTVIPYPVQVFGTLQWKKRPVIFAKILQVLDIPSALRVRDIMNTIAKVHLAESFEETTEEEAQEQTDILAHTERLS